MDVADLAWIQEYQWLIIIFAVLIILVLTYIKMLGAKRVLKVQALKRNGTVSGILFSYTLNFSYKSHTISISQFPGSRYRSAYTRADTFLNEDIKNSIKIYSETFVSGIGKKLGMQDIKIGSFDFDDKFMIKGTDELFVIKFLNYALQDKLLQLRKYKPTISIENNQLSIYIPRVLKKEIDYDILIESMYKLIDRIIDM